MAAEGGSDCPPPPPPPPPNNNNNNNAPKSPNLSDTEDHSHEELSDDIIDCLRVRVVMQSDNNDDLHSQVLLLTPENSNQVEEEVEPEPEQVQIQAPEDFEDDDLELQGAAAAAAPEFFFEGECPEDLPLKFDGNPDMLGQFISQCQIFMERSTRDFSADRVRVCFVTSMLTGRAARWASAKLERSSYLMHNYRAFMMELKHVFEDPQRREAAKRKIRRLRQGMDSVVEYANTFQTIAQDLDWNEPALMDQFIEGLADAIRAELAHHEIPRNLPDLINLCIRIERRQAGAAAAAGKTRSDPPRALVMPQTHQADPTEPVGGARMRLTQEEKERRRKLNLCLYCGNGGHYADNCPAKASKNSPPGNSPAPL